jgi:hypothetical protein
MTVYRCIGGAGDGTLSLIVPVVAVLRLVCSLQRALHQQLTAKARQARYSEFRGRCIS